MSEFAYLYERTGSNNDLQQQHRETFKKHVEEIYRAQNLDRAALILHQIIISESCFGRLHTTHRIIKDALEMWHKEGTLDAYREINAKFEGETNG